MELTTFAPLFSDKINPRVAAELGTIATRFGGEIVESEVHAKWGAHCVSVNLLPCYGTSPIIAFPSNEQAWGFIEALRPTGYADVDGHNVSTFNLLGNTARMLRAAFAG